MKIENQKQPLRLEPYEIRSLVRESGCLPQHADLLTSYLRHAYSYRYALKQLDELKVNQPYIWGKQ